MVKTWICIFAMFSLPTLILAQIDEKQFQHIALLIVEQRLEQRGGAPLSGIVSQIARETYLTDTEVRHRLVDLLDNLETQRLGKNEIWKQLMELSKKQGTQKRAEKFMRQIADAIRRALLSPANSKSGDGDFKSLVADAEANAQFAPDQGKDLVLQMLSLGSASTVPRLAGVPQKISLLVEVQSTPAEVVSAATDPPVNTSASQSKLDELSQHLLPALVQGLSTSGPIKWAGDQPTAQATPDYRLVVTLQDLKDSNNGGPQQITLIGQLALLPLVDENPVYQRPLIIRRIASREKMLDPASTEFCNETASKIRYLLESYLAAR